MRARLIVSTAFFGLFVFFFFVNGNRVQVFGFEYLTAVEAAYIVDAIPAVEKLGSLVLTTLHSEVTPILDRASLLSSTDRDRMRDMVVVNGPNIRAEPRPEGAVESEPIALK